jgi:hypothetical protein
MGLSEGIQQGVQGTAKIAGSLVGGRGRRREEREAKAEYNSSMQAYKGAEFTNAYGGLQNTMEDLTVNTQQANFMAQQQQQGMANTMGAMQGAAGGSGIAALAQAMSNQQSQNLQQSSASIGMQESQNQMASARMAGQNQMMNAQGEAGVQEKEFGRTETLLGMSQQRLGAAKEARAAATQALVSGIGDTVAGGLEVAKTLYTGGVG